MKDKSHLTAITRKSIPSPVRWLMARELVANHPTIATLDFGCGKCRSVNPSTWDNYDPYYAPDGVPTGKRYMVILCTYVLCVLPEAERRKVLKKIRFLLSEHGFAYITVRNDKPQWGWGTSKRGTYQGRVQNLDLPLVHKTAQYRIYLLTKKGKSRSVPTITKSV